MDPTSTHLILGQRDSYDFLRLTDLTPEFSWTREGADLAGQIEFSRDGEFAAYLSTRHLVKLVRARTGEEVTTLETTPATARATAVSFSRDGSLLAVGHWYEGVRLWNLARANQQLAKLHLAWPATYSSPPSDQVTLEIIAGQKD